MAEDSKSQTVSFRLPTEIVSRIDYLAEEFAIKRTNIMQRLIIEGINGLDNYAEAYGEFDWPRKGRMKVVLLTDKKSSH